MGAIMKSAEQIKDFKLSSATRFNTGSDFAKDNITVPQYSDQNLQSPRLNGEDLNDAMVLLNDLLIATAAFYPQAFDQKHLPNNIALKLYRWLCTLINYPWNLFSYAANV